MKVDKFGGSQMRRKNCIFRNFEKKSSFLVIQRVVSYDQKKTEDSQIYLLKINRPQIRQNKI